MAKKKTIGINDVWRDAFREAIKTSVNETDLPDDAKQKIIVDIWVKTRQYFDMAVREVVKYARAMDENKFKVLEEQNKNVQDFLYWNPPLGGFPDSKLRIGVGFEVGGAYENWGYVVEQNGKTITTGRTLDETLTRARYILKKNYDEADSDHKCSCGNEGMIVNNDTKEWLCTECFNKSCGV